MNVLERLGLGGLAGCTSMPRVVRAPALATALLLPVAALSADPAGPRSVLYVGGHVGYGFGNATATPGDPAGVAPADSTSQSGTLFGGVQAGYQQVLPSRWMLGLDLDLAFADFMDAKSGQLSIGHAPAGSVDHALAGHAVMPDRG